MKEPRAARVLPPCPGTWTPHIHFTGCLKMKQPQCNVTRPLQTVRAYFLVSFLATEGILWYYYINSKCNLWLLWLLVLWQGIMRTLHVKEQNLDLSQRSWFTCLFCLTCCMRNTIKLSCSLKKTINFGRKFLNRRRTDTHICPLVLKCWCTVSREEPPK